MIKIKSEFWVNKTYQHPRRDELSTASVRLTVDYSNNRYSIKPDNGRETFIFTDSSNPELWNAILSAMKDANKIGKKELEDNNNHSDLLNNLNNNQ
jgi:hypothetical protein